MRKLEPRERVTLVPAHYRRGQTCHATTARGGLVVGGYLGTEITDGESAILLRNQAGTTSLCTRALFGVEEAA